MALTASRFLDPKADVVFKKIFGNHADLLKSFLNAIMPLPQPITHLTYLMCEQAPTIPELKRPMVDVKCEDASGRIFIIEMQMEWSGAFAKRILYTVSQAYVQQLDRGKGYKHLCPVYGLALLNENCDDSPEWYHHYHMRHVEHTDKKLEGIEIILLELKKFQPRSWDEKRLGVLWLRFLKELADCVTIPKEFESEPEIVKACELAQEAAYSKAELRAYNEYWDAVQIERTLVEDGEDRGEARGREEGIKAVAKALISKKMDDAFIAETTGLTLAELATLRNETIA